MGWALDGRFFVAPDRRTLGGSSQWPVARRTLERSVAEPCPPRISLDRVRRPRRRRDRGGLAAQGRRLHQAQLPRPRLDHGLDVRDALEGSRRKPTRPASSARTRAELTEASPLSTTFRPTSALRHVPTA